MMWIVLAGFGFWIFDLGMMLAHHIIDCKGSLPKIRQALIEGHKRTSVLPESNLEYLDLFTAARLAQLMFFYQGLALIYPQYGDQSLREINQSVRHLKRILKRIS
ncbi:MAG: hypothetical protein ACFFAD_03340 [Candidatus Hermodarchaeota archaeon]